MPDSDQAFSWAGLIDIGAITGVSVALLYTAGWSYAYHYFQQFHLGLIGLEIEREYFLLYGFWVCKARFYSVLLCLLAAFGLPLLLFPARLCQHSISERKGNFAEKEV